MTASTTPLRAALYLRVSTARQAEHDVSIPDQKRQGEGEVRITGSKTRLLQALTGKSGVNSVPTQGLKWRANPEKFGRSSANTHPFERELGGRSWVFAHNGKLEGLRDDSSFTSRRFKPIGETDSELAFCLLLDAIALASDAEDLIEAAVIAAITPLIEAFARVGEFNFMMSDGERLYVHAHTRVSMLRRICRESGCEQEVVVLATQPLTEEAWTPLAGLHVFSRGRELALGRTTLQNLHPDNLDAARR